MRRLIIFLGIIAFTSHLYSQDWMMVSQLSGTGSTYPTNSVTDNDGNIYVYGYYTGIASIGAYSITSRNASQDIFLAKYDSDGNILWLNSIGSKDPVAENSAGIALSPLGDAIYVCGDFRDTCYFDASALISQGFSDVFLAKYNTSGSLIWAKNIAKGVNNQRAWSVDVDAGGYVVVSGFLITSADFDPGPILFANGFNSPFVARYDDNGTFQWAKGFLGKNNNNNFRDIIAVDDGYVISGQMRDSLFLDIDTLVPGDASIDLYVIKLDFNGNGVWARELRGAGGQEIFSRLRVFNDNVYVVGMTQAATLLIDSTATDVINKNIGNAGNNDMFITSFTGDGTFRWCTRWGSALDDRIEYLSAKSDKILVTGRYAGDLTVGSFSLTWLASSDAYRIVMDTTGVVTSVTDIRGTGAEIGTACNIDFEDNDVLIGAFTSLNLTIGSVTLVNPNANNDVYIAKYGCPKVTPAFSTDSVTCPSGNDGTATVTPSGMTSYLWSTTETTETITNLTAGTYIVTVTGLYGCKYVDSVEVAEKPGLSTAMDASTFEIDCAGGSDGVGIVYASDGKPAYSYLWDNSITNDTVINLTAGVHYVSVTDGCTTKVDSVEITYKPTLFANLSKHAELLICALDTNGEVTVQITDGVAPFTYTWDDGVYPSAIRNNLDTGWHYVSVTDVCNIPNIDSIRVNYLPEVNINITSSSPASCPASGDGYAYALALSGVPPYTYIWSNSASTTNEATDLLTGWQYVTVSDFCTSRIDSIEVVSNPPLETAISAVVPANCSGAFNGSATVTPSNGGGSYTYLWTSGENTATATALGEGLNYVTVTDLCLSEKVDSVITYVQSALVATVSLSSQATCPTSSDGKATVDISSGVAPFIYAWSSGGSGETEPGLPVGWVYVTITDGCGPKVDSIEVTNKPVMQVSLSTHNILLTCAVDLGTATVQTQDGVPPFVYTWDDGVYPNPTRSLDTGWHYVTVTDFCNMPYNDSVRVNHLPEVVADIVSSAVASCPSGGDGSATVQASSGVPPYDYAWSNSTSNSAIANDLLSGWQYVTVSDYCTSRVDSVEIGYKPDLEAAITDSSNVSCSGGNNGSASVTTTNGGLPYTYLWTSGEATATATQLQAGWNYVTVSDLCGTVIIDSVEIFLNALLGITSIQVSPTSCDGGNNGSATVMTSGGSAPITYLWSDTSTNQTAINLTNDTVYVTVTDACGFLSTSAYVDHLPLMEITITANVPASCPTSADGKAYVTATYGSGFYSYQWSNSASLSATATDLLVGVNYVTVTDACGSLVDSVEITNKPLLNGTVQNTGPATCPTDSDGIAIATPVDGVQPYSYAWSASVSTDSTASDLPIGTNTVTITDVCGSVVLSVTVSSLPVMTHTAETSNLLCFSDSSGTIEIIPSSGVPPYTYLWADTTLTDSVRTGLLSGTYTVTISDVCGSTSQSYTLSQPGALSISLLPTNVQFQGESTGIIDLIVSGGTAPHFYVWSNASQSEDQNELTEGTYTVTVTDNNGCMAIDSVEIISLMKHIVIYSAFTPNADGKNDVWNIKYINNFPECEVNIYNEWGVSVFKSTGYGTPWDGTKDGKALPAGSYYYVIDLKDGSEAYTGSVTLMK